MLLPDAPIEVSESAARKEEAEDTFKRSLSAARVSLITATAEIPFAFNPITCVTRQQLVREGE